MRHSESRSLQAHCCRDDEFDGLGNGSPYLHYVKWSLPKTFIWHAVGSILGGQIRTGRLFLPCSDEPAAFPISESFFSPNPPKR